MDLPPRANLFSKGKGGKIVTFGLEQTYLVRPSVKLEVKIAGAAVKESGSSSPTAVRWFLAGGAATKKNARGDRGHRARCNASVRNHR
jgi:hypothetical protein